MKLVVKSTCGVAYTQGLKGCVMFGLFDSMPMGGIGIS